MDDSAAGRRVAAALFRQRSVALVSANGCYCITQPVARTTACRRSLIPRTGVTALSCPLRGQLFVFAPPPVVISTEARSRATSEAEKSLTLYACFCNEHRLVYTFRAFISYPGDFSTAHGRQAAAAVFRAPLEMTGRAAWRRIYLGGHNVTAMQSCPCSYTQTISQPNKILRRRRAAPTGRRGCSG